MDDLYTNCTVDCERMPYCTTCGQRKGPIGRSVPLEAANSYCGYDCPDYRNEPTPGHLWPGELARIREDDNAEQ